MTIKDNLTREEAAERTALLSDLRYDVSLDQTQGPDAYRCEVVIRFRCASPGASTFLDFVGGTIEEAHLNDRELPASIHDGERIHLEGLAEENELFRGAGIGRGCFVGLRVVPHVFEEPIEDGAHDGVCLTGRRERRCDKKMCHRAQRYGGTNGFDA